MQTHTPITLDSQPVLSWEAPTRPIHDRTARWYMIAGAVVLAAATYGIFTGAWSFAVVCVLAGGMYVLTHDHKPSNVRIELHDSGMLFAGEFIRWDELAGFWFLRTPEYTEVRFVPRARRSPIVIQTGTQDTGQLRLILGQRLPELKKKENILELFIRICKL